MAFRWIGAVEQHVGGRQYQEDSCKWVADEEGRVMAIVADGLGGHKAGDKASLLAVEAAEKLAIEDKRFDDPRAMLMEIVNLAQQNVLKYSKDNDSDARTTIVTALCIGKKVYVTNVGDSRAYRITGNAVVRLTRDDSVPEMLFRVGEITEEEMATHPQQGSLTKSIGGDHNLKPQLHEIEIAAGDVILLCSDGFWEQIKENEYLELCKSENFAATLSRLCAVAVERGGDDGDNVTVCAMRLEAS